MSGHSKWAKVKYQKAVKDPKKSRAFSKIANLIAVAARNGSDIEANPKLRLAIDKAKAVGLNVKLETGKNIKILKYSGEMEIKYMKEGANKP